MKLQIHHFIKEERPKLEDFPLEGEEVLFDQKAFRRSTALYNLKYVKPKKNWVSFESKKPRLWQNVWLSDEDNFKDGSHHEVNYLPQILDHNSCTHWCDIEAYNDKCKYYEDHKVLFEGFVLGSDDNKLLIDLGWLNHVIKGTIEICFRNNEVMISWYDFDDPDEGFMYNGKAPSIELFRMICKENGIEL